MSCRNCKWLDKSRKIYWHGCYDWFYVCKKHELEQKAYGVKMNQKTEIFAPSQLKVNGEDLGIPVCENMELDDVCKLLEQGEFDFQ